jgi:hypothetical protein
MRIISFSVVASLTLASAAVAQQTTGTMNPGSPPAVAPLDPAPPSTPSVPMAGAAPLAGGPLLPGTTTGLDKVADDGVSTKTVRAVPCGKVARETDGFTTCVGIPDQDPSPRMRRR